MQMFNTQESTNAYGRQGSDIKLLSKSAASKILKIGRDSLNKLINEGRIGIIKIGKNVKIPFQEIARFVNDSTERNCIAREINSNKNRRNITQRFSSKERFQINKGMVLNG